MDTGLKGMGKKKSYYSTEDITIPVLNTRSVTSKIKFVSKKIKEHINETEALSSNFIKDMISRGRYETYLKLVKIEVEKEVTNFIYQINIIVREQKKVY